MLLVTVRSNNVGVCFEKGEEISIMKNVAVTTYK